MEQPVRTTLRSFFQKVKGVAINFDIKRTVNGIPFISMLVEGEEGKNEHIMLCLSKAAAQRVEEQGITNIKDLRDKLSVVEATNAEGEERLKLSFNGDYQSFD